MNKNQSDFIYLSMQKIRVGAICNDGTYSTATGSGACSWHGGVKEWLYKQVPIERSPRKVIPRPDLISEKVQQRRQLDRALQQVRELRKKVQQLKNCNKQVHAHNQKLSQTINNQQLQHYKKATQLESQVHDLTKKLVLSQAQIQQLKIKLQKYQNQPQSDQQHQLYLLKLQNQKTYQQYKQLYQEKVQVQDKYEQLKLEVQLRKKKYERQIQCKDQEINEIKIQLKSKIDQLERSQASCMEWLRKNQQLQENIISLEQDIRSLQQDNIQLVDKLNSASNIQQQNKSLQTALQQLQQTHQDLKTTNSKQTYQLTKQLQLKQYQLKSTKSQLLTLHQSHCTLKTSFDQLTLQHSQLLNLTPNLAITSTINEIVSYPVYENQVGRLQQHEMGTGKCIALFLLLLVGVLVGKLVGFGVELTVREG